MNTQETLPELEIWPEAGYWNGLAQTLALRLVARNPRTGLLAAAVGFTMEEVQQGQWIPPGALLSAAAAQDLMDRLWTAGVRPRQQEAAGQLSAVDHHLQDLRAIAVGALNKSGVRVLLDGVPTEGRGK